ncbi:MAG: S46 family peptidase [Elusimicrobia bacterium]|nr:S46 family peptidase [Elusimicrobiota bacterium]
MRVLSPAPHKMAPTLFSAVLALYAAARPAWADEGMWTFHNLPVERMRQTYGFAPSQAWLDHVRLSSVRFGDGGSGAFVSPHGLILTNHHVVENGIKKLDMQLGKDWLQKGFYARSLSGEVQIPDAEVSVLVSMRDVTSQVLNAAPPEASEKKSNSLRESEIARIEKDASDRTGAIMGKVVSFHNGSQHWLYIYKRFTDVRLVMTPESRAANFGGSSDVGTYPRYDLDFAFLRVYENGVLHHPNHYLQYESAGSRQRELLFVSGHPRLSRRMKTLDELRLMREIDIPVHLDALSRVQKTLLSFSPENEEENRQIASVIHETENFIELERQELSALTRPGSWDRKEQEEISLRAAIGANPKWNSQLGRLSDDSAMLRRIDEAMYRKEVLRDITLTNSSLARIATNILHLTRKEPLPNEDIERETGNLSLDALRLDILSTIPFSPRLEIHLIASALQIISDTLGPHDPYIRAALDGRNPREVAEEVVSGTHLGEITMRRALIENREAVVQSQDPLIRLVLKLEPYYQEMETWFKKNIEEPSKKAQGLLARVRFLVYGHDAYPDVTSTLRLNYGILAGYKENGRRLPHRTTFADLFSTALGENPIYHLAPRVARAQKNIDMRVPLNFVTTHDTRHGNSGSPVVNKKARWVGIIFDGNVQDTASDLIYDNSQARSVSVHADAILEALRNIYGAPELAEELTLGVIRNLDASSSRKTDPLS